MFATRFASNTAPGLWSRPASPPGQTDAAVPPPVRRALMLVQVDELAEIRGQLRPWYPEPFQQAGITGEVKLEYVIDSMGRADTGSVRVISATEPAFAMSSIEAVLGAGFKPARRARRAVAMLVRQTIRFQDR